MVEKVCVLINTLAGGGAERVALDLCEEYRGKGIHVFLVCLNKNVFYTIDQPVYYLSQHNSARDHFFKKFSILFPYALKLKKMLKHENISVVQSHLYRANYVNILAKRLGAGHRAQLVTHGIASRYKNEGLSGRVNLALIKKLYPWADQLVFPSMGMRNDVQDLFGFRNDNMHVINNPVDVDKILIRKDQPVEPVKFVFEPGRIYAVAAGRMEKVKRFQDMMYAVNLLKDMGVYLELLILGDGPERARLEALADRLALKDRVHFPGMVDNPFQYMAKADMVLSASENESFSNVIAESLACGTPVIATDCVSGPREILAPDTDTRKKLRHGEIELAHYGILVPVNDPETMAKAITSLLKDKSRLGYYSEKGIQRARDFRKELVSGQYIELMNTL